MHACGWMHPCPNQIPDRSYRCRLSLNVDGTAKSDRVDFSSFPRETGCLEWIDVAQSGFPDGFWSVVVRNVNVGGNSVLRAPAPAILDTGTSMIVGPFDDVAYLAHQIGALCVSFSGADSSSVEPVSRFWGCGPTVGLPCHPRMLCYSSSTYAVLARLRAGVGR